MHHTVLRVRGYGLVGVSSLHKVVCCPDDCLFPQHFHSLISPVFLFQIPMMRDPGWIRNVWPSNINVSDVAVNVPLDLYISRGGARALTKPGFCCGYKPSPTQDPAPPPCWLNWLEALP